MNTISFVPSRTGSLYDSGIDIAGGIGLISFAYFRSRPLAISDQGKVEAEMNSHEITPLFLAACFVQYLLQA